MKRLLLKRKLFFFNLISQIHVFHFSPSPPAPSFLSSQDENAAAQGVHALHGGPVRHLLPTLLQGPPLCLPAARALRPVPQHQVLHHGLRLLLGEGCGLHTDQPRLPRRGPTLTSYPSVGRQSQRHVGGCGRRRRRRGRRREGSGDWWTQGRRC